VGSGPNGLTAAVALAEAGRSVLVLEAAEEAGGGLRTAELVEPGFRHDVCAAVMALVPVSPALRRLPFELVEPAAPLAHPLDGGQAVVLERSVPETADALGADGPAYRRLVGPLVSRAPDLFADVLRPARPPRHPLLLTRFGVPALVPAFRLARMLFAGARAQALLAGAAAHSQLSLGEPLSSAIGLVMLTSAHAGGWPVARGGSGSIAAALVRRLEDLGGELRCEHRVRSLEELPRSRAVLLDLVPRGALEVAGDRFPGRYRRQLAGYRHGPGVWKLDWTLDAPIPWSAPACARAGTVHLGGTLEEIAFSEREVAQGRHPDRPFVLLVQPTLFDPSRAPAGRHIAWAYCHVPAGSERDMTDAIERQVERFAPGFREVVRGRGVLGPRQLEARDANCVGGDINGGRMDLRQTFTRPVPRLTPYATPDPAVFLCSAATPPGGSVHGMCGWHAARLALRRGLRQPSPSSARSAF
jgi:phytoene dehydrogenase-like protein